MVELQVNAKYNQLLALVLSLALSEGLHVHWFNLGLIVGLFERNEKTVRKSKQRWARARNQGEWGKKASRIARIRELALFQNLVCCLAVFSLHRWLPKQIIFVVLLNLTFNGIFCNRTYIKHPKKMLHAGLKELFVYAFSWKLPIAHTI